jgi:hypothetical protein
MGDDVGVAITDRLDPATRRASSLVGLGLESLT